MKVAATPSIASRIALAFQSASSSTGTDFGYLVKTASRESNFDTGAKANSSSATGLFQFIESTWLETVKTSGDKHGLGDYADDITQRSDGSYTVSDPARRREILELRKDPEVSAMMAGEFTRRNATYLENKLGREPSDGELYAAHFLGAGGASKLISLSESDPDRAADRVFPRQARANKSIFYDDNGSSRSVSEVLDSLVAQHDSPSRIEYATVVAASKPVPTPVAKAQAIAAAAGVTETAGADAQAVIASRYYRPEETQVLSDALAISRELLNEDASASADPAAVAVLDGAASDEAGADETGADETDKGDAQRLTVAAAEGAVAGVQDDDGVTSGTLSAFAPMPPAPKPVRDLAATAAVAEAESPVSDPAVAVALAEAETVAVPVAVAVPANGEAVAAASDAENDSAALASDGSASARISAAWRATQASTPFQALFRTGETPADTRFDDTFVSAFRARPAGLQAAVEAHTSSAETASAEEATATKVASASTATTSDGKPFDLTGFLKYQIFKEPEDLVPPA